jgi:hypothetical protein
MPLRFHTLMTIEMGHHPTADARVKLKKLYPSFDD